MTTCRCATRRRKILPSCLANSWTRHGAFSHLCRDQKAAGIAVFADALRKRYP